MKTKSARISAILFPSLLIVSALAIFVPTAAAQGELQATVDSKFTVHASEPVLPDTGVATLKLETKVTVPPAASCIVAVTVQWTKGNAPSYASVIFSPSSATQLYKGGNDLPTSGQGGLVLTYTTDITITVTRDAPAFKDDTYEVQVAVKTGTTQGGCNIKAPDNTKVSDTVKNGYFPLTAINPSSLFIKAGQNKKVVFPIEVQNLGNGPTRVKVELTKSGKNQLDSMNAGAEIRLESKAGRGASATWKVSRNLEVQTPHSNGYTNSIYSFIGKFSSSFDGPATGTLLTDDTQMTFSVQVQGVYVPGPDPIAILVGLGVAVAMFAHWRRR